MSEYVQGVYVDLDSLLDTRLGVIRSNYVDIIPELNRLPYHTREEDAFPYINVNREEFEKLYKERNVDTLAYSYMSNMVFLLKKTLRRYFTLLGANPLYNEICLYVNTAPYQLDEEELIDIHTCLARWLDPDLYAIKLIDIPVNRLYPSWFVQNSIDTMFCYDYDEWLKAQYHNFAGIKLHEMEVVSTALYRVSKPTDEEYTESLEEIQKAGNDVNSLFEYIELLARPYVTLSLIDVRYFSMVDKKTLKIIDFIHENKDKKLPDMKDESVEPVTAEDELQDYLQRFGE